MSLWRGLLKNFQKLGPKKCPKLKLRESREDVKTTSGYTPTYLTHFSV